MSEIEYTKKSRPVGIWLLVGVFMIMIQVVIGGITRLTGSGLSITDWDPIMGFIPPLSHEGWLEVFALYQQTPQYLLENSHYTLEDFKFIYFWEWFHRVWARLLGVVFLIPFIIFLIQKRFTKGMVRPMIVLFILGGLQGFVGWIMVQSGLVGTNTNVNHIKLTIHFMAAMVLLCYTLWFAMRVMIPSRERLVLPKLHDLSLGIIIILSIQLAYGGIMAGLGASMAASTWPSINGYFMPPGIFSQLQHITDNPVTVQFIHRGLAYILAVLIFFWWMKAKKQNSGSMLAKWNWLPLVVVLLQITLGVLTVMDSKIQIPVTLAVSHQFVGMLLLEAMFLMLFLTKRKG